MGCSERRKRGWSGSRVRSREGKLPPASSMDDESRRAWCPRRIVKTRRDRPRSAQGSMPSRNSVTCLPTRARWRTCGRGRSANVAGEVTGQRPGQPRGTGSMWVDCRGRDSPDYTGGFDASPAAWPAFCLGSKTSASSGRDVASRWSRTAPSGAVERRTTRARHGLYGRRASAVGRRAVRRESAWRYGVAPSAR